MGTEAVVLVVDDDRDVRRIIRMVVEDLARALPARLRVVEAADADEALLALRRDRPDLVLLDLKMPGLDGFDLCRRLRADPVLRAVPVVAVSALAPAADAARGALEAGCTGFLAKPFEVDDLRAVLTRYLDAT